MDLKKISIIVGLVLTLASVVGAGIAYDKNLAKQCNIQELTERIKYTDARLDQKILSDHVNNLQSRLWDLEKHYGEINVQLAPQPVKDEYRQLKIDLDRAKQKLRQMGG